MIVDERIFMFVLLDCVRFKGVLLYVGILSRFCIDSRHVFLSFDLSFSLY